MEFKFLLENLKQLCNEVYHVVLNKNKMFKSVGIQLIQSDLSIKSKSKMLKNPTLNLEELEKNVEQLLKDALEEQKITIRRVGVKVSELSEVRDQSSITNYF
jgi:DNA polymerase IV (DinB-like DNA polymerase)